MTETFVDADIRDFESYQRGYVDAHLVIAEGAADITSLDQLGRSMGLALCGISGLTCSRNEGLLGEGADIFDYVSGINEARNQAMSRVLL